MIDENSYRLCRHNHVASVTVLQTLLSCQTRFFLRAVRIFLTLFVLNIPDVPIDNMDKYILVSNTCVASESKQIVPDKTALKSSLIWDDLFAYAFLV